MAKRGPVAKYVVRLSSDERVRLEDMIGTGRGAAYRLLKARILLKADVSAEGGGWGDARIAEALETSASTVFRTRRQLVEEGLEAALARKKRQTPPLPAIFDGAAEAKLIDQSPVPQFVAETLVFSAKESFFKAAFPRVGRVFGFDEVRLVAPLSADKLTLRVCRGLADLGPVFHVDVHCKIYDGFVLTWCAIPR